MLVANNPSELKGLIERLEKNAFLSRFYNGDKIKVFGLKFGSESKESKYNWMNSHHIVQYQDTTLDLKIPTILGRITTELRYGLENRFNEGFIVRETTKESAKREIQEYERLNEKDFPTLKCLNYMFPEIKSTVITKKIDRPSHLIDIISKASSDEQKKHVISTTKLMKRLHEENVIWGDAWLGNSMYDKHLQLIYDFGLKPNEDRSKAFLMGKDLVSLCMSAVYRTGQKAETVIPLVLEAYDPSPEIKKEIHHSLYVAEKERLDRCKLSPMSVIERGLEYIYFKTVFGMNIKEVEKVREEIYKKITF